MLIIAPTRWAVWEEWMKLFQGPHRRMYVGMNKQRNRIQNRSKYIREFIKTFHFGRKRTNQDGTIDYLEENKFRPLPHTTLP